MIWALETPHRPKIWGASSNMAGKICPLVQIGLTDLPKTGGGQLPPPPCPPYSGIPDLYPMMTLVFVMTPLRIDQYYRHYRKCFFLLNNSKLVYFLLKEVSTLRKNVGRKRTKKVPKHLADLH